MNVLVISCHPDDMEIQCAGTLLKCKERGDNVTVCHVCNGNMGHEVIMPDELREIRLAEAQRSGAIGGFEVCTIDVGDLVVDGASMEQRDKVVAVIRRVKPDFIITHSPTDYMLDHRAVWKLAYDASFVATCPHYAMDKGPACPNVPLFYMDNGAGLQFEPTEYVDITDVIDKKIEMLRCHESQLKWLYDHDGIDFAEYTTSLNRVRGMQCGVQYAEGFRQEMAWGKVVPRRMLP